MSVLLSDLQIKKEWVLTSVYVLSDSSRRGILWSDLNRVVQKWEKPWVVGGDFNVTYFAFERNSDGHVTLAMGDFADWI